MNEDELDRAAGCLWGLAVGDAVGTTTEFSAPVQPPWPRLALRPQIDLIGGGPFRLAPGMVTDDTQMAAGLAHSLLAHDLDLDVGDVGARYVDWMRSAFDVGNQTRAVLGMIAAGTSARAAGLAYWQRAAQPPAGNGSLMRIAPLAIASLRRAAPVAVTPLDLDRPTSTEAQLERLDLTLLDEAMQESAITHADPRCLLACAAFVSSLRAGVFATQTLAVDRAEVMWHAAVAGLRVATARAAETWPSLAASLTDAAHDLVGDLTAAHEPSPMLFQPGLHLHQTAGFVRLTFRYAYWHLVHTTHWKDAVLDATNRGGDADTNAAVIGALCGARDGQAGIPKPWKQRVRDATLPGPAAWAKAHHPKVFDTLIARVAGFPVASP